MVIKEHDAVAGRRIGLGEPVKITGSTSPTATVAGLTLELPVPVNCITKIRGIFLDAAAGQTITGIFINSVSAANKIHDGAGAGTDITLTKTSALTTPDFADIFGEDIHVTDKVIVEFTQTVGSQTLSGTLYGTKYPLLA